MSLRNAALSGLRWSAAENLLGVVFSLVSVAILARLLRPEDFGLVALASVVLGFSQVFVDMGFSNAVLQRREITHEQLSTLYWLNILAGTAMFLLITSLAWVIAGFYKEPAVRSILILSALNLVIQAVGQQFAVLLRKGLDFEALAKIGVTSRAVGLASSIVLALAGFGVFALVYSGLLATGIASALTVWRGQRLHRPTFRFNLREVKPFFVFGAYQVGESTMNYFNANFDVLLIGRLLGAEAVGVYSMAKQFVMRPSQVINPIVTSVSTPVMARVQDDIPRLRSIYLQAINHLSSINFPVYMAIAVFADEITLLMFGEKWSAAAPLMRVLALFAAVRSTANPVASLVLSRGRAALAFWWNAGLFVLMPVAIFVGAHWGAIGVAAAQAAMQLLLILPNWALLVRPLCGARLYEYHLQILRPASAAVLAGLVAYVCALPVFHPLARLAVGLLAGGTATCAMFFVMNKGFLRDFRELLQRRA